MGANKGANDKNSRLPSLKLLEIPRNQWLRSGDTRYFRYDPHGMGKPPA